MNPNQKYIDGTWYEEEYAWYSYRDMYINRPEPSWARDCNQHGVDFITLIYGLEREAKILDCGAGVGFIMQAWRRRGFTDVHGLEISHVAVNHANDPNMIQGTVADMSNFGDQAFDLVSSFALLEHIDESIEAQVISEMLRVGKRQAHFMALDAGPDPSHVNIKTPVEWGKAFARQAPDKTILTIKGPLTNDVLLVVFSLEDATHPLKETAAQITGRAA